MAAVELRTRGIQRVKNRLLKQRGGLRNLRTANKAAAVKMFQWVQDNFDAEGGKHSNSKYKWPPLAASTIQGRIRYRLRGRRQRPIGRGSAAGRRIAGGPFPMLRVTGDLRNRWDITATNASGKLKSRSPISGYHEHGGSRKGRPPQRKIFPTVSQGEQIVLPVFEHFVRRELGE